MRPCCRTLELPLFTCPSPFEHILHFPVNQNPDIEDVDSTHSSVAEFDSGLKTELNALDSQIAAVELILATLRKQRQASNSTLQNHLAIISPIRYLPAEILADIFIRDIMTPYLIQQLFCRPLLCNRHYTENKLNGTPT